MRLRMRLRMILKGKSRKKEEERSISSGKSVSSTSRKVLKVMSVFTGVEFFGILCSMIKMKIIAIWLEATGIGFLNMYNSTVETTTFLTGLGIRQSSVRDLAKSRRAGKGILHKAVETVRSWSLVAALLGGLGLTALSMPLAELLFEDRGLWWNFVILGGAVMLNAVYAGESAIFQASEEFRRLAKAGVIGASAGLIVSIPLYYFLGDNGISLSIAAYSLATVMAAWCLRNRRFDNARPARRGLKEGVAMIRLGVWISMAGFFSTLCQLILMAWLNRYASIAEVGLYGAGVTLVVRYTGLVFNSVSLEFYPRISANIFNPERVRIFLNHEINLLLLLFTPLLLLFMIFKEWIVMLLYTTEFLEIIPFITWGIVLILFRAISNTMAMCILARGEGKIYMLTEMADALLGLGLSILFYLKFGLTGLGMALVCWHLAYLLIVAEICRLRYSLHLSGKTYSLISLSLLTAAGAIALYYYVSSDIISVSTMLCAAGVYFYFFLRLFRKRRKSRTPLSQ